jgi:O-antigen/teichoic acid export membrane protein
LKERKKSQRIAYRARQENMIQRVLKMLGVLGTSMGLTLITQFLLPPALLHSYGVSKYGEWLVLSGTLSYLATLNFGIFTYASNELTMLRKTGDLDRYRSLQGSTLALLLVMIGIGLCACVIVFLAPLGRLLHLTAIPAADVAPTALFLGLQTIVNILGGYYNSLFMVVEETHRGLSWANARFFGVTLVCALLATFRVSFPVLAIGQFVAVFLITLLSIYDLKRRLGDLPLGLEGANWKTAKATLAPSGMFAMIFTQQFLTFEAPLIMLQWTIGPSVVVVFSTSRTILSAARQTLSKITNAIAPEITFSFADGNMKRLLNIFHYSERIVFAGIPVANLGAYLMSPILLQLWLQRPWLFDQYTYALMALISGAMSMRDHKQYFQFSTNNHERLSMIVFFGNILMIAISIPATLKFGMYGFLVVWLLSELSQMVLIFVENKRLFNNDPSVTFWPVVKLASVMMLSLPVCIAMIHFTLRRSLAAVALAAFAGICMLSVEVYFVFGLQEIWDQFLHRMRRTSPA